MNTQLGLIDYATLPALMLPGLKRHLQVDFTDNDLQIAEMLQDAIGQFQRTLGITVFKSEITLLPEERDFRDGSLPLEVTPVNHLEVTDSADVVIPLTGNWIPVAKGVHGVRIWHLQGSYRAGMKIVIDSGYADLATLPPEIRSTLYKLTGHFYQFREIYIPGAFHMPASWLNESTAGFWMPRA